LNSSAVADLNASKGELWAVGGALTTLAGGSSSEYVFGSTGSDWMTRELVLTMVPVPVPGAALLGGLGLGFAGWLGRRRMAGGR
jgi:hypothetical protein